MENAGELTADSDMVAIESGLDLHRLLSEISLKARKAIQYVKLEGLSVSEAATRCGMSESAVKVAVHRGLKALALQVRKERSARIPSGLLTYSAPTWNPSAIAG